MKNKFMIFHIKNYKNIITKGFFVFFSLNLMIAALVINQISVDSILKQPDSLLSYIEVRQAPAQHFVHKTFELTQYKKQVAPVEDSFFRKVAFTISRTTSTPEATPIPVCNDCGSIESIEKKEVKEEASGAGAITGGVVGGVAGSQVGKGKGRAAMAVVGILGGAILGHQIEKSVKTETYYEVTVRMDDGSPFSINYKEEPTWKEGDLVRVVDDEIVARNSKLKKKRTTVQSKMNETEVSDQSD